MTIFRRYLPPLLLLLAGALGSAYAQDFRWLDVRQQVTVQPDGAVIVRDERTLSTRGDFGEAFICVALAPGQTLTLLEGGALSPGPAAEALQQPCEEGEGQEVVLRQAERVAERRVFFTYRLEGTLEAYSDVVAWYWEILERDRPPVDGYTLTVTAPGPMAEPYDAFVHRFNNPEAPVVRLSPDRSELSVTFAHVPAGDGVEIHYLMDPALFDAAVRRAGVQTPGLEGRLLEEARLANLGTPGAPTVHLTEAPRVVDAGAVTLTGTVAHEGVVTAVAYSLNRAAPAPCDLSPTLSLIHI